MTGTERMTLTLSMREVDLLTTALDANITATVRRIAGRIRAAQQQEAVQIAEGVTVAYLAKVAGH